MTVEFRELCAELVAAVDDPTLDRAWLVVRAVLIAERARAALAAEHAPAAEGRPVYHLRDIGDGRPVLVAECEMCGVSPGNVDDCGRFGDSQCPYFGVGTPAPVPESKGDWFYDFEQWLAKEMPAGTVIGDPLWWAPKIARAATSRFLASPEGSPAPVPVAERLPEASDCDEKEMCWFFFLLSNDPTWTMEHYTSSLCSGRSYWLPHWALPLPAVAPPEQP